MLNQQLRKQYLAALGIQLWVPRVELPGAKQACVNAEVAEATPACFVDSVVKNAGHKILSASNLRPDETLQHSQQVDEGKPSSVPEKQQTCINLGTIFYTEQCLVVAQLEANEQQFSTAALNLLSELLYALGIVSSQKLEIARLDWPPPEFVGVQLQPALDDLVRSLQLKQPAKFWLLLGEASHQLLQASPSDPHNDCEILTRCSGQVAVATLGLQQMLDNPQLKKQVWSDLQPLCQWLMGDE